MLRIGTRSSPLARWQAEWVAGRLTALGHEVQLVWITTRGDADRDAAIAAIDAQPGVFTKELQRALLDGRVDVAVHSLKDLPTDEVPGLVLAAVPQRESPRDVLVSRDGSLLAELPRGARIGTGSLRRRAQLLRLRPDLVTQDIRGNVETRVAKLDAGEHDAIVLAEAGLTRLGLESRITEVFSPEQMLGAVGQGALAIETRADDADTRAIVGQMECDDSRAAVEAERAMLHALLGGCLAPVGGWGRVADGTLLLDGVVIGADGRERLTAHDSSALTDATALGRKVAQRLIDDGAARLIAASRAR